MKVSQLASALIKKLLLSPATQKIKREDIDKFIRTVLPHLITKAGDQNVRIRKEAIQVILEISKIKNVSLKTVLQVALEPISAKAVPKIWSGRMQLLETLILELKLKTSDTINASESENSSHSDQYSLGNGIDNKSVHKPQSAIRKDKVIPPEGKLILVDILPLLLDAIKSTNTQVMYCCISLINNMQIRNDAIKVLNQAYLQVGSSIVQHLSSLKPTIVTVHSK